MAVNGRGSQTPGQAPGPPPGLSLDALAADPAQATGLSPEALPALLARCAAVQSALAARLASGANGQAPEPVAEDRLLTVAEAAQRLGVSHDWLYRRAGRLPFAVRLGRHLRFSAVGMERYIRQRQGR